ncbi:hypothetical protein Syun_020079 [Stephania yunnanensis]|uniref:Uncharacterized protein n=1 Tax=Stephania yunnanensis TaxID=152371 RepID=A0AAP0IX90_9MAGN
MHLSTTSMIDGKVVRHLTESIVYCSPPLLPSRYLSCCFRQKKGKDYCLGEIPFPNCEL